LYRQTLREKLKHPERLVYLCVWLRPQLLATSFTAVTGWMSVFRHLLCPPGL
jgi:hypothetical protein